MIYVKTAIGQAAMQDRSAGLSPRQRSAFIMFDGKRDSNAVIQAMSVMGVTVADIDYLVDSGMLAPTLAAQMSGINHGRGRPVFGLPTALGRLQAALMSLAPGEPLMSRDNLDSMSVDNVTDGKLPGLTALGITPASLLAVGPDYFVARGKYKSLQDLRRVAGRG